MQICLAIFEEVDIICLQEICQTMIRQKLLKALEDLKYSGATQYFFPNNLETHPFMRTTMILSKYPVKFGHLQF
jgi:endonuclease/exonuclease/phosphatase family metal-dependent hydrolase